MKRREFFQAIGIGVFASLVAKNLDLIKNISKYPESIGELVYMISDDKKILIEVVITRKDILKLMKANKNA